MAGGPGRHTQWEMLPLMPAAEFVPSVEGYFVDCDKMALLPQNYHGLQRTRAVRMNVYILSQSMPGAAIILCEPRGLVPGAAGYHLVWAP